MLGVSRQPCQTLRQGIAVAIALCAMTACTSPSADVLAVWLDASVQDDGTRKIQLYDSGTRRAVELRPTIAQSATDAIQMAVAPDGHGFAVSSVRGTTVWHDLQRGTRASVGVGPWGDLAVTFFWSRSGRAIIRDIDDDLDPGSVLLPISIDDPRPLWFPAPDVVHPGATGQLRSASDAPVIYWFETGLGSADTGGDRVDGTVAAYRYPADDDRTPVDELVEIGRSTMHTRWINRDNYGNRIGAAPGAWCTQSVCVTPDGDVAIGIGETPCQLLRFHPTRKGESGETRLPREIDLPSACLEFGEPHLVAALDARHVLLDDESRLYLADLDARTWQTIPKLGATTQVMMLPAQGGRAMNVVSADGTVIRADVDGFTVVNAERVSCELDRTPVSSPSGQWILAACKNLAAPIVEVEPVGVQLRTLFRVSSLGIERFDGLAMRVLAIDDGGQALLHSYNPDDSDELPRGLFVLDGDGQLARVDDLEPPPVLFRVGEQRTYFDAAAR